jgi:hypothetical protein
MRDKQMPPLEQTKKLMMGLMAYALIINLMEIDVGYKRFIIVVPGSVLIISLLISHKNDYEEIYRKQIVYYFSYSILFGLCLLIYKYWWETMPIMADHPIENIYGFFVLTPDMMVIANLYRFGGFIGVAYLFFKGKDYLANEQY